MIDESRLNELEEDFGAEDLAEIIDTFLAEVAEGIDVLGTMLSDDASPERKAQLHFLKGCSRNIGASDLADLCQRYEQAESAETRFGPEEYAQVTSSFAEVQRYFSDGALRKTA